VESWFYFTMRQEKYQKKWENFKNFFSSLFPAHFGFSSLCFFVFFIVRNSDLFF